MPAPEAVLSALSRQAQHHITREQGCRLAWQQWSSQAANAQPLLLIHGGFGSWTHWVANIEALSERYAVWTVDLPGLGDSGDLTSPWSTQAITESVLAGWRVLPPADESLHIAGFSFGGLIAGQFAALLGDQCIRCILIGASGFGPLHVQAELLPPPSVDDDAAVAESIHRENLARLMIHDPDRIDSLAAHIHADNLARHRLRSRGMAGSNDLAEVLPEIPARLVGIWGEYDATAGGPENLAAREQLFMSAQPDAEFHILRNVGHWAMYEAPSQVNRLISSP